LNRSLTVTILGNIDPILRPNGNRPHWRALRDAKADAKAIAIMCTRDVVWRCDDLTGVERAVYDIERGIPKGGKQLDEDNLVASLKSALDGIAFALEVDDRHWKRGTVTQVRDKDEIGYITVTLRWQQVGESVA
jgi:hypothetical protein